MVNPNIKDDMVVFDSYMLRQWFQTSDWMVTPSNGSLTITNSGSLLDIPESSPVVLSLKLVRCGISGRRSALKMKDKEIGYAMNGSTPMRMFLTQTATGNKIKFTFRSGQPTKGILYIVAHNSSMCGQYFISISTTGSVMLKDIVASGNGITFTTSTDELIINNGSNNTVWASLMLFGNYITGCDIITPTS